MRWVHYSPPALWLSLLVRWALTARPHPRGVLFQCQERLLSLITNFVSASSHTLSIIFVGNLFIDLSQPSRLRGQSIVRVHRGHSLQTSFPALLFPLSLHPSMFLSSSLTSCFSLLLITTYIKCCCCILTLLIAAAPLTWVLYPETRRHADARPYYYK